MNNASTVALRTASHCFPFSPCLAPLQARNSFTTATPRPFSLFCRLIEPKPRSQRRTFCKSTQSRFQQSPLRSILKPYESDGKPEKGLKFEDKDLGSVQLRLVFGRNAPPPNYANRLLRLLNARRVDGTLDIPLPSKVEAELDKYPNAVDKGLAYLRKVYPVDEDAAIMARIEREDDRVVKDNPSELVQRGQDIGLYKGPQSGYYQAELSEKEGDVYGRSELDRMRAEYVEQAEREEEELQAKIEAKQAQAQEQQQMTALAQRPEQGVESAKEIRPPNSFEKWVMKAENRATSKLSEDSPEIASRTLLNRLLPSFLFLSLVVAGCYLMSEYWVRPKQADRLWPNLSLAWATVAGLIAANTAVYVAWRIPGAWKWLNRYFLTVTATPSPLSMIGATFSHQEFGHLARNMFGIVMFGIPLHEQIGRGDFLAVYFASGAIAAFAGLAWHASRRVFTATALGASGAWFGIAAAYLTLHLDDHFSIIFLPKELAEYINVSGMVLLGGLAVFQVVGLMRAKAGVAWVDHLGGMVVGVASAWWIQHKQNKNKAGVRKSYPPGVVMNPK
ncbi:hypothetical protein B0A52_08575 [Exophiala mesophila]|uniref:Peptidase S54 rhomboid domain-containing protein n=1 Tax=Exophiala mesophila TaxID=212818 RepID=A0A438MTT9_EXOME|nr:hypothetical protein B0A52_08575 [Exophiala mesophila]